MYKFLQSKKGFTLTELMIVLILLGLGAFALINLFRVAYRSFDKSEERYIKQEAVKDVSELLQKGVSVTAAKTADIFTTLSVVPNKDNIDKSYSYLYAELKDRDKDGVYEGYYLYIQNAGEVRDEEENEEESTTGSGTSSTTSPSQKKKKATLISETPMYIEINAHQDYKVFDPDLPKIEDKKTPNKDVENKCAVTITLAALESDFDYGTPESPNIPTSDEIYYSLDVTYHFPNMATSKSEIAVNFPNGDKGFQYNTSEDIVPKAQRDEGRAVAATYNEDGSMGAAATAEDTNGTVLRIFCDSILDGDNAQANVNVPKMCFIATASYGADSGEVGLLCDFRDNCLLTNPLGTAFVKTYYKLSPPLADFIAQHETLRVTVRTMLKPLVIVAEYSLNHELISEVAPLLIISFALGLPLSITAVGINKKRKHKAKY